MRTQVHAAQQALAALKALKNKPTLVALAPQEPTLVALEPREPQIYAMSLEIDESEIQKGVASGMRFWDEESERSSVSYGRFPYHVREEEESDSESEQEEGDSESDDDADDESLASFSDHDDDFGLDEYEEAAAEEKAVPAKLERVYDDAIDVVDDVPCLAVPPRVDDVYDLAADVVDAPAELEAYDDADDVDAPALLLPGKVAETNYDDCAACDEPALLTLQKPVTKTTPSTFGPLAALFCSFF